MDATEFTQRLQQMSAAEIHMVADLLRERHESIDGDMAWWRATALIERELRRRKVARAACRAGHLAATAVRMSAASNGLGDDSRDEVIQVARAAGDAARALTAPGIDPETVHEVLSPWRSMLVGSAA